MRMIDLRFGAKRKRYLASVAEGILKRTQKDVARRLAGLNEEMSAAEARGYVRVRAASIVHREVLRTISQDPRLRPSDHERLADAVSDQITETAWSLRRAVKSTRAA